MKEKLVYNVDTGATEILKFMRMNNIHHYNSTIGNFYHVDQLRRSYRVDHWLRNRNLCWLVVFWVFGLFLKNAYVLYLKTCDDYGIPKVRHMTHLEFRKGIELAWINPEVRV